MTTPNPGNEATLEAIVHGSVQGVGFRYFVESRAQRLGVRGTVRNVPDGTVEVRARGDRNKLEQLLNAVKQGPPAARVARAEARWDVPLPDYNDFSVAF